MLLSFKLRTALLTLLLAASTLAAVDADTGKAKHKESELEGKMDVIGGAFRKLKRQISDPAKVEDSLKLVMQIKEAAFASAKLTPEKAAQLPEADRAKFVADYQTKMNEFMAEVEKLEANLKEGKFEDAAKVLAQLNTLQKSGHKEFKKPDKKD